MVSPTARTKVLCAAGAVLLAALAAASLFIGKYPLTLSGLLAGEEMQLRVFWTLRASRTAVGAAGGFALGAAGFVYQTVFRNPLASPDVIGVSSGASAGAAAGILFLSGAAAVTAASFAGALAIAKSRLVDDSIGDTEVNLLHSVSELFEILSQPMQRGAEQRKRLLSKTDQERYRRSEQEFSRHYSSLCTLETRS